MSGSDKPLPHQGLPQQQSPEPGVRIYLVGGAVRDELLGLPPPDRDYVVIGATQEEFLRAHPGAKKVGQGDSCVFIHRGSEYTLSDQRDIHSDLQLRDLTINAAARDQGGETIALPQTLSDLRQGILRPVQRQNFHRDPLRAYRSARIAACFPDFSLHPQLRRTLRGIAAPEETSRIAAERVCAEVLKACACPEPGRFLWILFRHGLLRPWFRELEPQSATPGNSSRGISKRDLELAVSRMNRQSGDCLRVWMALCACLGASERAAAPDKAWDEAAAGSARTMAKRMRMPNIYIRAGFRAAGWIRAAMRYSLLSPEDKVDLLLDLQRDGLLEREMEVAASMRAASANDSWRLDLERINRVRLPPDKQGLGRESGRILKRLRCESIRHGV